MKNKALILLLIPLFFACGNSNFLKQKYTDLKSPVVNHTNNNSESDNLSDHNQFHETSSADQEDIDYSTNNEVDKSSYNGTSEEFASNDDSPLINDHLVNEDVPTENASNSSSSTSIAPQRTEDDDEERDIEANTRINYILALLVTATICTYFAAATVGFAFGLFVFSEVLLYIAVGMALIGIIAGILTFVQAMKLRKIKEKSKETVYMYFGIIGGLVFAGLSLLQIFYAGFAYLF